MKKYIGKNMEKIELMVVSSLFFLPLVSFLYMDTNSIIRCGIDVFKSVFEGKFGDYYSYALESRDAGLMVHPPTYDIIFYITVGIWELPIAIIETLTKNTLQENLIVLMYSKCLLFVFLLGSAYMVKKICLELKLSLTNARWASFMFLTSGMLYSYTAIAGQYDIMGIFFSLVGIYFFIKKDRVKFILFFAWAVQYKYFPLFIFIPLILLEEKKIWKIVASLVPAGILVALGKLPFRNDGAAIEQKNAISQEMYERLIANKISIFEVKVPLIVLLFGAVCFFCLLKDVREEEKGYYAIYGSFLGIASVFLSFPFFPYWLVYLTPWIPILFFMRKDLKDNFLITEALMTGSVMIAQYKHYDWIFELSNMDNMFSDKVFGSYRNLSNPVTLSNINNVLTGRYEDIFYGIYIVSLIVLVILCYPKEQFVFKEDDKKTRKILWLRFCFQYCIGAMPFVLYVLSFMRELFI